MPRPTGADLLVGGCAAAWAGADVWLYRNKRPLVTDTLRRPVVLVALVTLTLHALDVLGPLDPFRASARLIPRR